MRTRTQHHASLVMGPTMANDVGFNVEGELGTAEGSDVLADPKHRCCQNNRIVLSGIWSMKEAIITTDVANRSVDSTVESEVA